MTLSPKTLDQVLTTLQKSGGMSEKEAVVFIVGAQYACESKKSMVDNAVKAAAIRWVMKIKMGS